MKISIPFHKILNNCSIQQFEQQLLPTYSLQAVFVIKAVGNQISTMDLCYHPIVQPRGVNQCVTRPKILTNTETKTFYSRQFFLYQYRDFFRDQIFRYRYQDFFRYQIFKYRDFFNEPKFFDTETFLETKFFNTDTKTLKKIAIGLETETETFAYD